MLSKKHADVGCMYAETFGCKVGGGWVHVCGNVWAHVCGWWVQVCGGGLVQSRRVCGACMRIRVETVTTYCQAGFQPYETCTKLSHTCTQTFPHTDYLLSGKATYCRAGFQPLWNLHPTAAYMHPNDSAYMHPTTAYFAPKRFRIHAPKRRILCTQE